MTHADRAARPTPAQRAAGATLVAVVAQARDAGATERSAIGDALARSAPPGSLLLRTCHRVEWYGASDSAPAAPAGARVLRGHDAARHLIRLAVGLESALLGEDQVLHQLRTAAAEARRRSPLPPTLDRLLDLALRAGRVARSWQPAGRSDLAAAGLARIAERAERLDRVLVVGAGPMARLAVRAATRRHLAVAVTSRTPDHAAALATSAGAEVLPFDPGPEAAAGFDALIVALAGPWLVARPTLEALVDRRPWLLDLSAPPAAPATLRMAARERSVAIDDLASLDPGADDTRLRRRLERLAGDTEATYVAWLRDEPGRAAVRATAGRAARLRDGELSALWQRLPTLAASERAEVEAMAHRLTERLLREALGARR